MNDIGVIGAGRWGKNIIRVVNKHERLFGLCDTDYISSSVPNFTIGDIGINKAIKGVIIATPPHTHYEVAKTCLQAGLHVMIEKPMTTNVIDAVDLIELAKDKNLVLMVGHLLIYHPAIIALKLIIDNGFLGNINYISAHRLNLGQVRKDENVLWSFAPHDISIMIHLTGRMPRVTGVSAGTYITAGVADVTMTTLEFGAGIKGHIYVSWMHPYKEHRMVVVGSKAMAVFDDGKKDDKLTIYNKGISIDNGIPVLRIDNDGIPIKIQQDEPLDTEISHYLDCIDNGWEPITNGTNGLEVVKLLSTCQEMME